MILMTRVANTLCLLLIHCSGPCAKGFTYILTHLCYYSPFLSAPQRHLLTTASLSRPGGGGTLRTVGGGENHDGEQACGLGLSSFESILSAKF